MDIIDFLKKKIKFTTTHVILFSFLMAILVGALLLSLPISSSDGTWTPFVDALFTATTSTCVTGLVVAPTYAAWSTFGHIVIIILVQIGGLGVITVVAGLSLMMHKKMGLSDNLLLQDAFNLNSLSGLSEFVKKVIIGTFVIEGLGAVAYMTVFIPEYGLKGIWISLFTSVSAFCNAGIDIIASDSFCSYVGNPVINITTCLLIILGGLGFIVWWDVIRVFRESRVKRKHLFRRLTLQSKIAIVTTLSLIFGGALLFFIFEYNNPMTMKDLTLGEKIYASIFQSVTTRTAGFLTLPQECLTNASAVLSIVLMFIGGSPVGTAGGIKTVTFMVLICSTLATIKNKNNVSIFNRTLTKESINKAVAVLMLYLMVAISSTVLLSMTTDAPMLDVVYEVTSAVATVGLTRNLTPTLSVLGKLIVTATMYFGRIGPMSLALALNNKKQIENITKDPAEDISVG